MTRFARTYLCRVGGKQTGRTSVSRPSSNRTGGFPASGFPSSFRQRRSAGVSMELANPERFSALIAPRGAVTRLVIARPHCGTSGIPSLPREFSRPKEVWHGIITTTNASDFCPGPSGLALEACALGGVRFTRHDRSPHLPARHFPTCRPRRPRRSSIETHDGWSGIRLVGLRPFLRSSAAGSKLSRLIYVVHMFITTCRFDSMPAPHPASRRRSWHGLRC